MQKSFRSLTLGKTNYRTQRVQGTRIRVEPRAYAKGQRLRRGKGAMFYFLYLSL